ncbi:MAG TPA: hypothetical protein VNJ07_00750 [Chitinophagales bacterium]|nr:hypothetical protein [Chitinophagales bacterium]
MTSLSPRAKKSLVRIGDILLPKNEDFPAFSETGSIEYIDNLTACAPESDIHDLNRVLSMLSYMPDFVLKWLVSKMVNSHNSNGMLSSVFRQLDFGLRGLIFSCYYSGKTGSHFKGKNPLEVIGFEIKRVED